MNGLWITIFSVTLLLCVLGLAFDRDRRHRTRGVHHATSNRRVDKLERHVAERFDEQDERIDESKLIATEAHVRLSVRGAPMMSPPTDGLPGYADTVVLPVGRPRRSWWTTSSTAAGIVLTIVGFVGAMLMVLPAKPTADRQGEPIPPRPPSPRPVDPPSSDAPAPTEGIPDGPDRVVVGPPTTVTVTVTETAVEMLGPTSPTRQTPASGAPLEATGPPTTTTPPAVPAGTDRTDGPPCPTQIPVPPPAGCVITPQLGP